MQIINKVINCQSISWDKLKKYEFNDLKDGNRDLTKLKNSIVNDGFCFPMYVWAGHRYVIDGNGRNLALNELQNEGYEICDIPIVEIQAETKNEAKQRVLQASSTHGQVSQLSFTQFTADMNIADISDKINFDNIDFNLNDNFNYENANLPESNETESSPEDFDNIEPHKLSHTCPKCGFEFNSND